MKILVVATQVRVPDTHGGSTHVGELVAGLSERAEVQALARRGSTAPGFVGLSHPLGFPPVLKHLFPIPYLPAALKAARAFGPDVIYERGSSYGLGAYLSLALRAPMICMVLDEHYSPLSLRRARRIISTNTKLVPAPYRDKAVRVSWGANASHFRPGLDGARYRERFGFAPTDIVLGYAGSFKSWHGLETLVDALAAASDLPLRCLMIGDGPLRAEIEARARAAGVLARIAFAGPTPYAEVPSMLSAADICLALVDASRHAGTRDGAFAMDPLKVFESLALGKPVICTRVPNVEELFTDGEHLWMVAPQSAPDIVRAVRDIARDPGRTAHITAAGRERVLARHTWQSHVDHLMSLFREIQEQAR